MITDERLMQLMQQVGMPNSASLMQALRQCDMEATLAERERCAKLVEDAFAWTGGHGEPSSPSGMDVARRIRAS